MAERARQLGDFKGVGHFEAKFQVEELGLRFAPISMGHQIYGNGCTTTLPLPLEVFTQRNFVADFIRLKFTFIQNTKNSLFEPPFGGISVNVRTQSIAHWKARDRLTTRRDLTFSLSLTVETL